MATAAADFRDLPIASEDRRWQGPLFVLTILVGSFLLFLVQPMIARMVLPRLGGAPAVWNSAMLVYQALLLAGYAYAHAIARFPVRRQAAIQLGLLAIAALWLPIGLIASTPSPSARPELWVPWLLTASIGPLFFAVAAQAPLMQRWYNAASGGRDPYALYAASNLGSFGGLIAYPLLVEPRLALASQSVMWTAGYVLLAALVIGCALVLPRGEATEKAAIRFDTPKPTLNRRLYWIALALVPSGLMLSTTTYLTTDIFAMPMLWVLPLGLYLLSFVVAFARVQTFAVTIGNLSPLIILVLGAISVRASTAEPFFSGGVTLLLLFCIAVTLHNEMYRSRPDPERLTEFYLCMSIGGALGGVFSGLLAPVIFDWTYEHALLILAAGALAPQIFLMPILSRPWRERSIAIALTLAMLALTAVILWLSIERPWPWLINDGPMIGAAAIGFLTLFCIGRRLPYLIGLAGAFLSISLWYSIDLSLQGDVRSRSYFGVYTVRDYPEQAIRSLSHGTTSHGIQIMRPERALDPTSYYAPSSGVGQALIALPAIVGQGARVGVVGLGTGTLACYSVPGQSWTFYEIDPTVIDIARDSGKFTYLPACLPNVPIKLGDARLTLAREPSASKDLIALDAFSSDVVPMHLLTREAFATYGRVLSENGLLLVHISNRYLDLEPVVAAAAAEGGWTAALLNDVIKPADIDSAYVNSSVWVAMSRDPAAIGQLINTDVSRGEGWRPLIPRPGFQMWTDDFASILPLVMALQPDVEPEVAPTDQK